MAERMCQKPSSSSQVTSAGAPLAVRLAMRKELHGRFTGVASLIEGHRGGEYSDDGGPRTGKVVESNQAWRRRMSRTICAMRMAVRAASTPPVRPRVQATHPGLRCGTVEDSMDHRHAPSPARSESTLRSRFPQ